MSSCHYRLSWHIAFALTHSLPKLHPGAAELKAVGVVIELLAAGFLHFAEEVQGTLGDLPAFSQAPPRVPLLLPAQHELLQKHDKQECVSWNMSIAVNNLKFWQSAL